MHSTETVPPLTCQVAATAFGGVRRAAVCRELTKTYEEIVRGPLDELVTWAAGEPRGEICVVVGGAEPVQAVAQDLVPEVLARADAGERLKDAVSAVAEATGVVKRDLYAAALAARGR